MKRLLFVGPFLTASGYGEHARQVLRGLVGSGKFEVQALSLRWGDTPFVEPGFDPDVDELRKYAVDSPQGEYDISVQVTIPNEFERRAPVNVCVTAGIEVNRASPTWIQKVNEVADLVIVPSKHSAETLANVAYQGKNGEELRVRRPVAVVPEWSDPLVYNADPVPPFDLGQLPEFCFLSVGLGLDRPVGEDRKNIGQLVKWFLEEFKGDQRVGLVLKTGIVGGSLMDFEAVKNRIGQIRLAVGCGEFPRIKVVHGRLTPSEMARVYKHPNIKAYVTLTHGEGFGLPILEAAMCGLPVIATDWSGHVDFLSHEGKKKFVPVPVDMGEVPKSQHWQGVVEQGTLWANPKEKDAKELMRKVMLSYDVPKKRASELASLLRSRPSVRDLGIQLSSIVEQCLEHVSRSQHRVTPAEAKQKVHEQLKIPAGKKTLLYTMPMSAGDVFISTAVVDSLKKKFPEHLVFFATDPKYQDILKGNPDVERTIAFEQWMTDVPFLEGVFDEVYTPNLSVQMNTSNWVHGGKGRLLGNELAAQCGVEFGQYKIEEQPVEGLPEKFVALHCGSGKDAHEARNYRRWRTVVHNVTKLTGLPVVQVGSSDDRSVPGTLDFRGKTTYNQLYSIVRRASCLVSIDSVAMHMAAAACTPHVAIFGSSYASSTGPVLPKAFDTAVSVLLEPNPMLGGRKGCEKACYKNQCVVDREDPCVNNVGSGTITHQVMSVLDRVGKFKMPEQYEFEEIRPKIAGYTHVFNAESQGFPYVESIKSMLGFCDQVVVVDGGSKDGTVEKIQAINDPRIKLMTREWDWNEPGMDGMQKAFGRAMADVGSDDFLWQQDADEVVHEDDYQKILALVERFPSDVDVVHLPVVELWGDGQTVRTDRHSWKWRLSRNVFTVTHGINARSRVFDEKTGKTYAVKGQSDGCEYIDTLTGEFLPHKGFYTRELEFLRQQNPEGYGRAMNKIFGDLPSVFHYSWADLPRKVRNFRDFWDKCWSNLYNEPAPTPRFPDVKSEDDVVKKAEELRKQGGEHGSAKTFKLERSNPALMKEWLDAGRPDHDDVQQAEAAASLPGIAEGLQGPGPLQADSRP